MNNLFIFTYFLSVSPTELSFHLQPGETTPDKILLHSTVLAAMDPGPKESDSFSWRRHKRERLLLAALSLRRTGELGVKDTPETPFSASTICHRPTLCHGYGHAHTHLWCLNLFSAIAAHQHTLLYCIIFYLCFFLFVFITQHATAFRQKCDGKHWTWLHGFEILISETVQVNKFYERCWKKGPYFFVCLKIIIIIINKN